MAENKIKRSYKFKQLQKRLQKKQQRKVENTNTDYLPINRSMSEQAKDNIGREWTYTKNGWKTEIKDTAGHFIKNFYLPKNPFYNQEVEDGVGVIYTSTGFYWEAEYTFLLPKIEIIVVTKRTPVRQSQPLLNNNKNPDGEIYQYQPGTFEKIRDNVPVLGGLVYDTANGIYTTVQILMFRQVGVDMVNLDRTMTTTDQAVLGLVSTVTLGAEWVNGIAKAAGSLGKMKSSVSSWVKFNSEFKFRPGFKSSIHKMTLKGIEYRRMILRNNTMYHAIDDGVNYVNDFMNTISFWNSLNYKK